MGGFPGGPVVKNPLAKQETQVRSLGREDPLEKGVATDSSINRQNLETTPVFSTWMDVQLSHGLPLSFVTSILKCESKCYWHLFSGRRMGDDWMLVYSPIWLLINISWPLTPAARFPRSADSWLIQSSGCVKDSEIVYGANALNLKQWLWRTQPCT